MLILSGTIRRPDILTFSPAATALAVTGQGRAEVWNVPDARLVGTGNHGHPRRLAFTPTAHRLYISDEKRTCVVSGDALSGYPHPEVPRGPSWFAFTHA